MKQRKTVVFIGIFFSFCVVCSIFSAMVQAKMIPIYSGYGNELVRLFMEAGDSITGVIATDASTYAIGASISGSSFCTEIRSQRCAVACGNQQTLALLFADGENTFVMLTDHYGNTQHTYALHFREGMIRSAAFDDYNQLWLCTGYTLAAYATDGSCVAEYELPSPAQTLSVTDGVLLASCSDSIFQIDTSSLPNVPNSVSCSLRLPLIPLGDGYFQDAYGNFCYYDSGRILQTGAAGRSPQSNRVMLAAVSGESAAYAESAGTIAVCDLWSGERKGTCTVSGDILSMAGNAVLLKTDGNQIGVSFLNYDIEPEPEPPVSSQTEPSSPEESGTWPDGVHHRSDYLEVQAGITAAQLKKNESVREVLDASGEKATGACRTGMTVQMKDGTILCVVVPGDANGSGTVNSADIRALQKAILGEEELSGAFYTAADVDCNGTVDTRDLLLVIQMFEQKG